MKRSLSFIKAFIASMVIATVLLAVFANAGTEPVPKPPAPEMPGPVLIHEDHLSKGTFLVAKRRLFDPRFRETVVLLVEYNAGGATGLVINRPTEVRLAKALPSMPGVTGRTDVIYFGGPVGSNQVLMLIRSAGKPEDSTRVFDDVYVSISKKTLGRIIGDKVPETRVRIFAGYAGWRPGQLEREVERGDWLVVEADAASIFETRPTDLWDQMYRIGTSIQVWNRQ